MASWWKLIAQELGVTGGGSSHQRRVASFLGATAGVGSWARRIAMLEGVHGVTGSWDKRMVEPDTAVEGASARSLYLQGAGGSIEGGTSAGAFYPFFFA